MIQRVDLNWEITKMASKARSEEEIRGYIKSLESLLLMWRLNPNTPEPRPPTPKPPDED